MANIVYHCTYCKKIIKKPPTPVWLCECGKPLYAHYKWASNSRDLSIDKKNDTENVIVELFSYRYIECPNNIKLCPICKGSRVMITETNLGKIYRTCPFSDEKGFLSCDQYNDFLRGNLLPIKSAVK